MKPGCYVSNVFQSLYNDSGVEGSAPWHLARICNRPLVTSGNYTYRVNGTGGKIVTIDTGVDPDHSEFWPGRATYGVNTITSGTAYDDNDHGTHVASLAIGHVYGVAKGAILIAQKALDSTGSGTVASVVNALIATMDDCADEPDVPFVVSMSLSGSQDDTLDNAITQMKGACHVSFSVAAGNEADNACYYSPGDLSTIITVCANDINDNIASFSNTGSCVKICAPGVNIIGALAGSYNGSLVLSGTSMSTPIVAGILLQIQEWLQQVYPNLTNTNLGTLAQQILLQMATTTENYPRAFNDFTITATVTPTNLPPPPTPFGQSQSPPVRRQSSNDETLFAGLALVLGVGMGLLD